MATLTFDNTTFERAEVAAAREGRSVWDLLNATLVDYAATVPLSTVAADVRAGEDGVGLYPRVWDDDDD